MDEMRGVAALVVLSYHYHAMNRLAELFPSGFLAVDLFFMLSGFVVAHAYERRILAGEMSFARFAEVRATRLYPLYILAAASARPACCGVRRASTPGRCAWSPWARPSRCSSCPSCAVR
ncbi:acyltransferase family protein [uncultured Sphingomonas sp.]|uniref:acyltransferase family protein n=1 Tax=uncultured Sphingomonas sp. TaxID=158754 RepID=UPI0035CC7640